MPERQETKKPRVLVLDDEPTALRNLVQDARRVAGDSVKGVLNPMEAFELLMGGDFTHFVGDKGALGVHDPNSLRRMGYGDDFDPEGYLQRIEEAVRRGVKVCFVTGEGIGFSDSQLGRALGKVGVELLVSRLDAWELVPQWLSGEQLRSSSRYPIWHDFRIRPSRERTGD